MRKRKRLILNELVVGYQGHIPRELGQLLKLL